MEKDTVNREMNGEAAEKYAGDSKKDMNGGGSRFTAVAVAVALVIIAAGIAVIAWAAISSIPVTEEISDAWTSHEDCYIFPDVPQPEAGVVDKKRSEYQIFAFNIYIVDITEKEANDYIKSVRHSDNWVISHCDDSTVLDGEIGFILDNEETKTRIRCYKKADAGSTDGELEYFRIYAERH